MDRSTMSQMASNNPSKAKIFPISLLSGKLVMRARSAGSILAPSAPNKVAIIVSHHKDGPVIEANTIDQRAMEINPDMAIV